MRKKALFVFIILALLLSSCSTSMRLEYSEPSNINMASYRNIAVASASGYEGRSFSPLYLRFEITDPSIKLYTIFSTFDYSVENSYAASELTKMVNKVFNSTSYYSTMDNKKTDTYLGLYKIGKDPSALLREDGIDALIIPKITRFINDEYVTAAIVLDSKGTKETKYYINRSIDIAVTLTVLDVKTDRIVAVKEYRASDYDKEVFDPSFPYLFSVSQSGLIQRALSSMIPSIVADFVPTRKSTSISLMSNKPKNESVKAAYDAAKDGNYSYALSLFEKAWKEEKHLPSAYNASLILAGEGRLDEAISFLSEVRLEVNDKDINRLWSRLVELKEKNEKAREQYEGGGKGGEEDTFVSPYEYLLN